MAVDAANEELTAARATCNALSEELDEAAAERRLLEARNAQLSTELANKGQLEEFVFGTEVFNVKAFQFLRILYVVCLFQFIFQTAQTFLYLIW